MAANRCGNCHRRLIDPASIAMGYGPECRGKMTKRGWKFPKPIYRVTHGKVELVRLEGDLTPPPAEDKAQKLNDEMRETVKRVISAGGSVERAVEVLHGYVRKKGAPWGLVWCKWFVAKVIKEMKA